MTKWVKLGAGIAVAHLTYIWVTTMHNALVTRFTEYVDHTEKVEEAEDVPAGE